MADERLPKGRKPVNERLKDRLMNGYERLTTSCKWLTNGYENRSITFSRLLEPVIDRFTYRSLSGTTVP